MPQTTVSLVSMAPLVPTVPAVHETLLGPHTLVVPPAKTQSVAALGRTKPLPLVSLLQLILPHLLAFRTFEEPPVAMLRTLVVFLSPPILEGVDSCLILSTFPSSKPPSKFTSQSQPGPE